MTHPDNSQEELLSRKLSSNPPRRSFEDAYLSSSDDDLGLEELDPLNDTKKGITGRQKSKRRQNGPTVSEAYRLETGSRLPSLGVNARHVRRWSKCMLFTMTFIGSFIAIVAAGGVWVWRTAPVTGQSPPWYPAPPGGTLPSWQESYAKAEMLVGRMSLLEKVNITTGLGWSMGMCVGNTGPASQVGFPSLCLQDGPLGLRFVDRITAFPAGLTTGATWNRDLMYRRGRALGLESRLKGINVWLGPAMGPFGRMPAGGRNWEGFGPDPVLQGIAAAETIRGVQEEGVIATAKHFILNEQEHFRQAYEWGLPNALSSNIDDRTLHELYLWPFADSVRAGVGSIMCAYNQVNNSYSCQNSKLLNGILKDELGFQGFVQSDWLAQRSGVASALAGLDMTMPGDGLRWMNGDSLWGPHLTRAVMNGSIPKDRLDDMATRIVAAWYQLGQDDKTRWPAAPPDGDGGPNFSSWTNDEVGKLHHGSDDPTMAVVNKFIDVQGKGDDAHGILAKQIAVEGTVLVKNNDEILPLNSRGWPDESGKAREINMRVGIFGEDSSKGKGMNACPDRGCNQGTLASGWGSGTADFPYLVTPLEALKAAFDPERVFVTSFPSNNPPFDKVESILKDQDICLVFVNSDGGEGYIAWDGIRGDRNDLYLQKGGDKLVKSVAEGCGGGKGSTIVVVHAIGPVIVEKWVDLDGVKAVVLANLPGQESGNAIADILLGNVNPSGKLPYTVGRSLEDYGKGGKVLYYPTSVVPQQNFTEGLYVDYRHFDKQNIQPRWEFGYGMSYTTFNFSEIVLTEVKAKSAFPAPRPVSLEPPKYKDDLPAFTDVLFPTGFRKLKNYIYPYLKSAKDIIPGPYPYPKGYYDRQEPSPAGGGPGGNPSLWDVHAQVKFKVKNTGLRHGQEVVQLYVSYPPDAHGEGAKPGDRPVDFPVKVLRAFEKISLGPGEEKVVSLDVTRKHLSYWCTQEGNWVMPTKGSFTFRVGSSSRDLPLSVQW